MESKTKESSLDQIEGRGGAAFTHIESNETSHVFLLVGGASRENQFDDFYKIFVSKSDDSVSVQKLNIVEMGGFGARHSMSAATWNKKTVLFGGQDVINDTVFNDLFVYNHETNEIEQQEYLKEGLIIPKVRNSQLFVQSGNKAFVYGGANQEGPLNDAFELDLETLEFKNVPVADAN